MTPLHHTWPIKDHAWSLQMAQWNRKILQNEKAISSILKLAAFQYFAAVENWVVIALQSIYNFRLKITYLVSD